jgi:putative FmdB family regulatory protein
MPTYEYLCRACGRPFEIQMSIREKEEWKPRCPVCGSAKKAAALRVLRRGRGWSARPGWVMPSRPRQSLRMTRKTSP